MKRKSINLSLMLLGSLVLVAFLISGCKKDQEDKAITEDPAMKVVNVNNSGTNSTPILLEDGTAIGEVIFVDDIANSMLYITFNLDAGYDADEMRLEIASKSKDIPAEKKGNLFPSDFNFVQSGPLSSHEFQIPFSYFGASGCDDGKPYYAAAYCLIGDDAAWGNGASNQGNSRGEIIGFKIECNTSGFDSDGIESAFAYGCDAATCFLSIDDDGNGLQDDFNRWGWTNEITDPGTYYFDIYAGAGQCNLTNGIIVGELIVYYDGTDVSVTYNTCGTYGLDETHLYVGTDMLPQGNNGSTIALGQFPYIHENLGGVQTDNYGPISITAPFYIIAHAVVEGDYTQGSCETAGCDYIPFCNEWIVYGSNLNGGTALLDDAIYAYDLKNFTQTLIYDPGSIDSDQNYPNGNAYDPINQRIYFGTDDGRLYYHEIGTITHVQVEGNATSGTFGTMASGAWYNGKYYYVLNSTNELYEVTIDVNNTASRTQIGTVPTSNGYGDIVFDPANPGIFIGCAGGDWYAYDVNNNQSYLLTRNGGVTGQMQLAYASNGVLYGATAVAGDFYEAVYDLTAGTITLSLYWDTEYTFTDLASGPQCN